MTGKSKYIPFLPSYTSPRALIIRHMRVLRVNVYTTLLYDLPGFPQWYPCLQEVRGSQKCENTPKHTNVPFLSGYTEAKSCSDDLKYLGHDLPHMSQVEYWLPMTLCRWYEVNMHCLHCLCTCTAQYNATQLPLTGLLVYFRA